MDNFKFFRREKLIIKTDKRKRLIFKKLHTLLRKIQISYGKKTVNVEDPSYFIEENLDLLNELHQTIMANSVIVQKVLGSFESTFFSLFLKILSFEIINNTHAANNYKIVTHFISSG